MTDSLDNALFTFEWGKKAKRAERRKDIIRKALDTCTFDFDRLLPEVQAHYGGTITVRFGDVPEFKVGQWRSNEAAICLDPRFGRPNSDLKQEDCPGIFAHETGHMVQDVLLTNDDRHAIRDAFCPKGKHDWFGDGGRTSIDEAFADAFAALYFAADVRPWLQVRYDHKLNDRVEETIRGILG